MFNLDDAVDVQLSHGAKSGSQLLSSAEVDVVGERVHRGSHGKGNLVSWEYSHRVTPYLRSLSLFLFDGNRWLTLAR